MRSIFLCLIIAAATACNNINVQSVNPDNSYATLRKALKDTLKNYDAKVGIALINISNGDTLCINNDTLYALQSTYKLPLAIAALKFTEQNRFSLQQKYVISDDLAAQYVWSPLKRQCPARPINLSIDSLIRYAVGYSDNLACDKLFEIIGGTAVADSFVHARGYSDMAIRFSELEISEKDSLMYDNNCLPFSMSRMLRDLGTYKLLNKSNTDYILDIMLNDSTSHNRLYAQLPPEIKIAHKTGTGINIVNDIGIVYLPNGERLALSVFIMHARFPYEEAERLTGVICKMIVDAELKNKTN